MDVKAFISGVKGLELTPQERHFFAAHQPWGFILFARNIDTADQLLRLTAQLREISGRDDVMIFIDQEGGRVQRLRPPLAPNYPTAAQLGALYRQNSDKGIRATWLMSRLHAYNLQNYGINADCLPVLDIAVEGAHQVIGDRAYGDDAAIVTTLGRAAADGLRAGGVAAVMKHIPGHGRALADTHLELTHIDASAQQLREKDFVPFKALNDLPMAMTAHLIYDAFDPNIVATASSVIIDDIIRNEIGFDNLLMSDDLSMKALQGSMASRTISALEAGCDIVLHCNGDMDEMRAVADNTPILTGKALIRAQLAQNWAKASNNQADSDQQVLREEFCALMGQDIFV